MDGGYIVPMAIASGEDAPDGEYQSPNTPIRDYGEGLGVNVLDHENGRLVIVARNQGGYDSTLVDLVDVIEWVRNNRPSLLAKPSI